MFKTLSKTTKILLSVVLELIVFRLFMPAFVKHYVNKSLNELPGYNGRVADADLHLYRSFQ